MGECVDLICTKKPLFESLINNVQLETEGEKAKRRKLDTHFPHGCRQDDSLILISQQSTQDPVDLAHHIHNSCFHTKIPLELSHVGTLSDYEFYVQFNNFTRMLGQQEPTYDPPLFQCQWDNCYNTVLDDTFLEHLQGHLAEKEMFSCEWKDCDHEEKTLSALLEHLGTHRLTDFPTASKNAKQDTSVVNEGTSTTSDVSKGLVSPPLTNSLTLPQLDSLQPPVNITSLKILPTDLRKHGLDLLDSLDQDHQLWCGTHDHTSSISSVVPGSECRELCPLNICQWEVDGKPCGAE